MSGEVIIHPEIESDELEVTVLGPGNGKGESIVIHLGQNQWAIVDSFNYEGIPFALYYLSRIGVDPDYVTLIICTHWHEDHIEGLSYLLEVCRHAKLCTPPVGDHKRFLQHIFSQAGLKTTGGKAWECLEECIRLIDEGGEEKRSLVFAYENVVLSEDNAINLRSLTPSSSVIEEMSKALVKIDPNSPNEKLAAAIKENMCSTVLTYYAHNSFALLGGDLENNLPMDLKTDAQDCDEGLCAIHKDKGWCHLLCSVEDPKKRKYSLVKIPHHSSSTAYCCRLWREHVDENGAVGLTTCFKGNGEPLPTKSMLIKYYEKCQSVYSTYAKDERPEEEKRPMPKTVNTSDVRFREIEDSDSVEVIGQQIDDVPGIIVCRRRKTDDHWECKPYGSAVEITEGVLSHYHDSYFKSKSKT